MFFGTAWKYKLSFKGSSYPSHFIFEINAGKRRFRHRTTPNLNEVNFQNYFKKMLFQIQSRSTSDPTLSDIDFKNEMTWVWTTLKLPWNSAKEAVRQNLLDKMPFRLNFKRNSFGWRCSLTMNQNLSFSKLFQRE